MNRILRRPMFRMGGSAEGITSGLDGPNINASRKGYKKGSNWWDFLPAGDFDREWAMKEATKNKNNNDIVVEQEQDIEDWKENMPARSLVAPTYPQDDLMSYDEHTDTDMRDLVSSSRNNEGGINSINTRNANKNESKANRLRELFEEQMKIGEEYAAKDEGRAAGMPGSMSSALMTFGLNLLGQPGGNLAGAIGKAGAPTLEKFQRARESERLDKRKTEREMRRDALDRAFDLRQAEIEADAEIKSAGQDEFAFSAAQRRMEELQGKESVISDRISVLQEKEKDGTISVEETEELRIKGRDLENNKELQRLITKEDKEQDEVAVQILKNVPEVFTFEEYENWKENGVYPEGFSAGKKDGGRAGYQMGGDVVEDVAMMSESSNIAPTAPAQTQDLTYDELRARLPREITNDVVTLIATSKQALSDFANIQTQQDVDNFNQTYNVNLVLPQEG